jgi:ATP-dependent helicase/nuclease subunit A
MKNWTNDQTAAITHQNTNLIVSASAGSGKTSVMIERIATMISNGASAGEFLILTFTNESARDMSSKLFERLNTAGGVWGGGHPLPTIGTFHKFCGDLIQTYFSLAGVNPAYGVLDENYAANLKHEILDEIIEKNFAKCGRAIDAFCNIYGGQNLEKIIQTAADFLSWQPDPNQWIENIAYRAYDKKNNIAEKLIVEWYNAAGEFFTSKFEQNTPYFMWGNRLKSVKSYAEMYEIARQFDKIPPMKRDNLLYETKEKLNEMLKKIRAQYILPPEIVWKNGDADREIVRQILLLVELFNQKYSAVKTEKNMLDFSDLERYALKILSDAQTRARINEKYKYIFVDEYQDTNPIQEKILSYLCADGCKIFTVGDIKQSIYGFRGTSPDGFLNRMGAGEVVYLNKNFRSNGEILFFANSVFSNIMRQNTAGADYLKTGMFETAAKTHTNNVEITAIEHGNPYIESAIIAEKITDLVTSGGAKFGDIAILARSGLHFPELIGALKTAGIKCITDKKQRASDLFEITLLNNFILAAFDPQYELPRALLMQSFIFNFTANDMAEIKMLAANDALKARLNAFNAVMARYSAMCSQYSVVDILNAFIAEFDVLGQILITPDGKTMVQNIYTFLNKLRAASYGDTPAQYVYMLKNDLLDIEIDVSAQGDCVKIMTIHSAKGLEFPIVFLYNAGANFSTADTRRHLMIDKNCGICVSSTDADDFTKTLSIARLGCIIAQNRQTIAEEMRLLYVALTRAQRKLFIVGSGERYQNSRALDDFEIMTARNYFDFIRPAETISANDIKVLTPKAEQFIPPAKPKPDHVLKMRGIFGRKYDFESATQMPQKISVTALTAHAPLRVSLNENFSGAGAEYGTRFHRAMEKGEFFDDKTKRAAEIIGEFTRGMTVYREIVLYETIEQNGENVLVQGVIDMLAISPDRLVLIDYKTNNAPADKIVETYRAQLETYAAAVGRAMGRKSEVYIYTTKHEKLIEILAGASVRV